MAQLSVFMFYILECKFADVLFDLQYEILRLQIDL